MSITRRNAITGATAAVAVAAVPVTVQANDAHIAALYAEWREAEAHWLKVNAIADDAHLAALRACREGATYRAAIERYGYNELKRTADVACAAEGDALHRFIEAPADGPRGAMIKLNAFIEEIEVVGMDNRMLETIRNDLERLSKAA